MLESNEKNKTSHTRNLESAREVSIRERSGIAEAARILADNAWARMHMEDAECKRCP